MRYVLITGAARGIGYALSDACLKAGDFVAACVRNPESARMKEWKEKYPERFLAVQMDISRTESVTEAAAKVRDIVPYLDMIINNAAIQAEDTHALIDEFCVDHCLDVFNVNCLGALRVSQALYPLLEKGNSKVLVNISSNAASIADTVRNKMFGYCMSKAALNMGSKILQNSLYSKGIKVLAVHPGWVRTDGGGPDNPLAPEESAAGILDTVEKYRNILNGPMYVDYTGKPMNY